MAQLANKVVNLGYFSAGANMVVRGKNRKIADFTRLKDSFRTDAWCKIRPPEYLFSAPKSALPA